MCLAEAHNGEAPLLPWEILSYGLPTQPTARVSLDEGLAVEWAVKPPHGGFMVRRELILVRRSL